MAVHRIKVPFIYAGSVNLNTDGQMDTDSDATKGNENNKANRQYAPALQESLAAACHFGRIVDGNSKSL